MVVAEKGKNSTEDKYPIQGQYLDEKTVDWRMMASQYDKSKRPSIVLDNKNDKYTVPFLTDHYSYIGSGY